MSQVSRDGGQRRWADSNYNCRRDVPERIKISAAVEEKPLGGWQLFNYQDQISVILFNPS